MTCITQHLLHSGLVEATSTGARFSSQSGQHMYIELEEEPFGFRQKQQNVLGNPGFTHHNQKSFLQRKKAFAFHSFTQCSYYRKPSLSCIWVPKKETNTIKCANIPPFNPSPKPTSSSAFSWVLGFSFSPSLSRPRRLWQPGASPQVQPPQARWHQWWKTWRNTGCRWGYIRPAMTFLEFQRCRSQNTGSV